MSDCDNESVPAPLPGNPQRQAVDSIAGYDYQKWLAIHAWLRLDGREVIYLEVGEDYDHAASDIATAVQVKNIEGTISLRRKDARDAIGHFWNLRQQNDSLGREIYFTFITRSTPGYEQGAPFGDITGIEAWRRGRTDPSIATQVQSYLAKQVTQPSDLVRFLQTAPVSEFQDVVLRKLSWLTAHPDIETIQEDVLELIYQHESAKHAPAPMYVQIRNALYAHCSSVIINKDPNKRILTPLHAKTVIEQAAQRWIPNPHLGVHGGHTRTLVAPHLSAPDTLNTLQDARPSSVDTLFSAQLNDNKRTIFAGRFQEALQRLSAISNALTGVDDHQKSRWHTQRGTCYWHLGDTQRAATEYERAYELAKDDDKAAANAVRALMLKEDFPRAVELAETLMQQFPSSSALAAAWVNAKKSRGELVRLEDIAPELRGTADIQFMAGWIALGEAEYENAYDHVAKAMALGLDTFVVRANYLRTALAFATRNQVNASIGALSTKQLSALTTAIGLFAPLHEKLWPCDDEETLQEVALHLTYAYLLTGQQQEAVGTISSAVQRFPAGKELNRCYVETLRQVGRTDEAYSFGKAHLEALDDRGYVMLAELAGNRGDYQTVESILGRMPREHQGSMRNDVLCFYWVGLFKSDKRQELEQSLSHANIVESDDIALLSVAARLNVAREAHNDAGVLVDRILELVSTDHDGSDVIVAAEACAAVGRFAKAASLLEGALPRRYYSELHERLLQYYISAGNRAKAQRILNEFPPGTLSRHSVRRLAISLASSAQDWSTLDKLTALELEARPTSAGAWGFRAEVLLRLGRKDEAKALLLDAPFELVGSLDSITQLAHLEQRTLTCTTKGLKRVYRAYRNSLEDVEAARAYLTVGLMVDHPESLGIDDGHALFVRRNGEETWIVVDPNIEGLAPAVDFINADDPLAERLRSANLNDVIEVEASFGVTKTYEVLAIETSYRALSAKAKKAIATSIKPVKGIAAVPVLDEHGELDLSFMRDQLQRKGETVRTVFSVYKKSAVPLSTLRQMLHVSPVELAGTWPQDVDAKLFVCRGDIAELIKVEQLVSLNNRTVVCDLVTVSELVHLNAQETLAMFPSVLIPQTSLDELDQLLQEAKRTTQVGMLNQVNGQLVFTDTEEMRKQESAHYERVREAIEKHCRPVAVYGPDVLPADMENLEELLDKEAFDVLMLALEQKALLLTLDGALRQLGESLGVVAGAWPQVVMWVASEKGVISKNTYSQAVFLQLAAKRTYVAVRAADIAWLAQQPWEYKQTHFRLLREHFASPTADDESTLRVIWIAAYLLAENGNPVVAFSEVLRKLLCAALASPGMREETLRAWIAKVVLVIGRWEKWARDLVLAAIAEGIKRRGEPLAILLSEPVLVSPIYVTREPNIRFTPNRADDAALPAQDTTSESSATATGATRDSEDAS